jgi:phage shock protein C
MTSDTKRLTRSTSDRKLGGVAGGLGEYFSVDPIVIRVGFAVATVFSGAGALAYLALLAFVPSDRAPLTPGPAAA